VLPAGRLAAGLTNVDRSVTWMTRLVEQLLDVARTQEGRPLPLERRPTDLVALARRLATEHQLGTERHRIEVLSALSSLTGMWGANRLERVLANLLTNAIKYSPGGGTVRVTISRVEPADGCWAVVSVHDSGVGIPAADLPRLFKRFQRGANVSDRISGTGIGLATARQLVELHGGTISVESVQGAGSTFTVRMPLSQPD
jgi:signal transduction histidine kinase